VRWSISFLVCTIAAAGPVEFGLNEYNAAVASRNLKWKVKYELTIDPPETFRIEPYKFGGAHVTGGDLRGLMYGLLEAADQVRSTGHLKQVSEKPATPVRGVRMFAAAGDLDAADSYWRSYFEVLARDRFNRFTLIFPEAPANLDRLRGISQAASDYAIDFTLGLWEHKPDDGLKKLLAACPLIRTVQIRSDSKDVDLYRNSVFKIMRDAGRRVALEPQGSLAQRAFLKAAEDTGVALRFVPSSWPASFEIDAPRPLENHALFYWTWGHVAYDPKIKPPDSQSPDEFRAAARITTLLAAAQAADSNTFTLPESNRAALDQTAPLNDWIATVAEAVRNRLEHNSSAKREPFETADQLLAAAASLDKTAIPDFQLLARLARFHAHELRAAYELELFDQTRDGGSLNRAELEINSAHAYSDLADMRVVERRSKGIGAAQVPPLPKRIPRPQITHTPVKSAPVDKEINLTLDLSAVKDVRTVRLHYRPVDSSGEGSVVEKPAAASMAFTIAGADSDLMYYFEIISRENSGWFEPDPDLGVPYHVVRIEPR
jgi:hypothetical protein